MNAIVTLNATANGSVDFNLFSALSEEAKIDAIVNFTQMDKQFWGDMVGSFPDADHALRVVSTAYGKLDKDGADRMAKGLKMAISRNHPAWLADGFTLSFNRGKVGIKALQDGSNKSRGIETFDDSKAENATVANSEEFATVANSEVIPTIDERDFEIAALRRQIADLHQARADDEAAHAAYVAELVEERDRLRKGEIAAAAIIDQLQEVNGKLTEERDTLREAVNSYRAAKPARTKKSV